ncbi:hypothetical protein PFICI_08352 [Pestalotiopsis fici W106-1]|uniref:Uncharacterized protein n=1 Tax=Pestalotiopsis fici (strain W106-1 / CGMCC3.15140) TaxID=1229662 RepID=W3X3W4_PESFW|nr:uncharacterized protein PFICI_08352 [Pestalotiopsis fici W106-1]ETS80823.1 hypothetical protein PFICI_08352 [Pestalotiopsis fici W106-1]
MDAMEMDLDVEMDTEFVPDQPIAADAQDTPSPGEVVENDIQDQPQSNAVIPNKVHLTGGLDNLNDKEVRAYVKEHTDVQFERLEWIDDNNLNVVFPSDSVAQDALLALASVEIGDVSLLPALELLPAKPFSQKAGISLQVRLAVEADKKQPHAAEKSRFYLLNPEWDRENRMKRYRDRDGERGGRRRGRREDEPISHFDVNLYDDDAGALATRETAPRSRRRRSYTPDYDRDDDRAPSYRSSNHNKELFPDSGSARDRSASPGRRDRDRDQRMDETPPSESSAQRNRRGARAIKDRLVSSNRAKELFPSSAPLEESNRLDDADELSNRFALPLYDGSHDEQPVSRSKRVGERNPAASSGRLADRVTDPTDSSGFSIRGSAGQRGADQGFAIKGGAKSARELFPDKLGGSNAGKELFANRVDGRSRRRQKAGDLFD